MEISEVYAREIAREILISMLHDGMIPSGEAVAAALKQRTASFSTKRPELSQDAERFEYLEEASASKMQRIINKIIGAIRVLYQAQMRGEKSIIESTDRALAELLSLQRRIQSVNQRATELLLTSEDAGGYIAAFREDFQSMDFISDESTCTVDNEIGVAYSSQLINSQSLVNPVRTERLSSEHFRIQLLDASATSSPGTRDSVVTDILTDSNSPWLYTARRQSAGALAIAISIDLRPAMRGTAPLKTRQISLIPYITNNSVSVRIQYSKDGIRWDDLPVENPQRTIAGGTLYRFEEIELSHLRIFLEKGAYNRIAQDGSFEYDFGIRNVSIADSLATFNESCELISKNIFFYDENSGARTFSRAVLYDACGENSGNTSTDFFISMLDEGLTRGPWQKVVPVTAGPGPLRLALAGDSVRTETTTSIDPDSTAGFSSSSGIFLLAGVISSPLGIQVWRNKGNNSRLYKVRQADRRVVEEGWKRGEGIYSTFFYVENPSGRELDFGPRSIKIDGSLRSGVVRLSQGIHFAEVREENWFSLTGLHNVTTFDPLTKTFKGTQTKYGETGFELDLDEAPIIDPLYNVIDPLYPFNQKLLIEGLDYNANFSGGPAARVYQGFRLYGADILQLRSNENLISSQEFSLVETLEGESLETRVAVHWGREGDEAPREVFAIVEKSTLGPASGLVFKAVFKTLNPNMSPTLEGYEIRVAE